QGLLRGSETESQPGNTQPVSTRTVQIAGLTVTSPTNWTLMSDYLFLSLLPPEGRGACGISFKATPCGPKQREGYPLSGYPVFQLANFDPGLGSTDPCASANLPDVGAELFIGYDVGGAHGVSQPIASAPLNPSSGVAAGPCGAGHYGTVGGTH